MDGFALLTPLALLGLPVAGWIVVRCMEHTERMEMIRRGMVPPPYGTGRSGSVFALTVLAVTLLAAAYLMGLAAIVYPVSEPASASGTWLIAGVLSILVASAFAVSMRRGLRNTRGLRALPPSRKRW